ncbi:MAG: hypothetical protein HUU35_00205 [Armatimonadetes bacterium]|nr:hypothetical protein [Armatimonadota bacterium]
MSRESDERVFSEAKVRRAGLVSALAGFVAPTLALFTGLLARWLLGGADGGWPANLIGFGVGLAVLAVASDYLFLGWFNRRVRRQLAQKLRRLGELSFDLDDPNVYFVGLAHPAKVSWLRWETDDEVGFLRLTFDGLEFLGDRLRFQVPFDRLTAVELEPIGYGLPQRFKRIRVTFAGGEPFEELLLCGREGDRLTTGNDETRTLHEALRQRWQRRSSARLANDPLAETLDAELEA